MEIASRELDSRLLLSVIALTYGKKFRKLATKVQDALAAATAIADEVISGIRTVRSFAREREEAARYGKAIDHTFQLAAKQAIMIGGFSGIVGSGSLPMTSVWK